MYKSEVGLEKYFTILPPDLMYNMCKIRCGSHKLPIELGRYFSIDRSERICDNTCKYYLNTDMTILAYFDKPMSTYLSSLFINSLKLIYFTILPPDLMYNMCKFRCGSHKLPI
jgi:hypothetical protein